MESEVLFWTDDPRFVQFNAQDLDGVTNKAFLFMITKKHSDDSVSGAVFCDDFENTAGLSSGWNIRRNVPKGQPGQGDTWCALIDYSD